MKQHESFYDILRVSSKASTTEIVTAYHQAKGAFAKDSIATYTLVSPQDTQLILEDLEKAFQVLSNLDKRRQYDEWLNQGNTHHDQFKPQVVEQSSPSVSPAASQNQYETKKLDLVSGQILREMREGLNYSQEDVSKITKIPIKFLTAIESDDFKHLPARVYLQGFLKNLCQLYRLDSKDTVAKYLVNCSTQ